MRSSSPRAYLFIVAKPQGDVRPEHLGLDQTRFLLRGIKLALEFANLFAEGFDLLVALLQLVCQALEVLLGGFQRVAVDHEKYQSQNDKELDEGEEEEEIFHVEATIPLWLKAILGV